MTRSLQGYNHQFAGTNLIVCKDETQARAVPVPHSDPLSLAIATCLQWQRYDILEPALLPPVAKGFYRSTFFRKYFTQSEIMLTFADENKLTLNIDNMEKTFIPEDNSVSSIKIREQIIRDFYREWKERNPSQRKFNLCITSINSIEKRHL